MAVFPSSALSSSYSTSSRIAVPIQHHPTTATTVATIIHRHSRLVLLPLRGHRWYHSTRVLGKDKDDNDNDDDGSNNNNNDKVEWDHDEGYGKEEDVVDKKAIKSKRYKTLHNALYSDEEIERMMQGAEDAMQAEEDAKYVPDYVPGLGLRKKYVNISSKLEDFGLELDPENNRVRPWSPRRDKRCGALAIKVGMMPLLDRQKWGMRYPCTVLYLDSNVVVGHKTMEKHGYMAVQVAAGERKRKNVTKAVLGQYKHTIWKNNDNTNGSEDDDDDDDERNPPWLMREFRVTTEDHFVPVRSRIHAHHFVAGQNVDVSGISKGKGFQGPMKRHGFAGMPASHGVSKSHRAHGSTGQCQDPGRVFKGKKMAGRMGNARVTVQNLRVVKVDRGRNLLYVHGAVPGNPGTWIEVRDAIKKPLWNTVDVLGGVDKPPLPTAEYDAEVDGCGEAGHEIWMPMPAIDPLAPDADEQRAQAMTSTSSG